MTSSPTDPTAHPATATPAPASTTGTPSDPTVGAAPATVGAPPPRRPLRVVQWATGAVGTAALRLVLAHPELELVGLWVHSPSKVGLDAGTLAGVDPGGVAATDDVDALVALGADCLLYVAQGLDVEVLCRFLRAGTNVVCTRSELHDPSGVNPEVLRRIEDACRVGGTTVHATGSSPGFVSEALPLALLSMQGRLDGLVIDEYGDLSQRPSPELLFDLMGFGAPPDRFDPGRWAHGAASFGPTLRQLAAAVGLPIDRVDAGGEVAVARRDSALAAGTVAAGTVAAQRMTVTGWRHERPLVRFRATWFVTGDLDPGWEVRQSGWRVTVEGDAPLVAEVTLTPPPDRLGQVLPAYTAHRAVHAIAATCAAGPGLCPTPRLPLVVPRLLEEVR